jgi:hypothetical protein
VDLHGTSRARYSAPLLSSPRRGFMRPMAQSSSLASTYWVEGVLATPIGRPRCRGLACPGVISELLDRRHRLEGRRSLGNAGESAWLFQDQHPSREQVLDPM